jgi:formylglycine-generating enzyme required for sulfatase activity
LTVKGKLAEDEVQRIALEVAYALKASHTMKIIHRDIKPANILLEWKALDIEKIKKKGMELTAKDVPDLRGARVRLTDFGIAQPIKESLSRSSLSLGDTSGTLTYMSPEQVKGKGIDHSCDLYALGVTMYELLRGQPPFSGDALVYQILNEVPEEIPGLSPHLQLIILKLLEKDKAKRIQTAEILIRELKGPGADIASQAQSPVPTQIRDLTGAWEQAGKKQALEIFEKIKTWFSRIHLQPVFEKARSLKRRNKTALALVVFFLLLLLILQTALHESGTIKGWTLHTNSRLWQGFKSDSHTDSITGMEFILVKGGCFPRGDIFNAGNADETPARAICLKAFYLGKYEVTQDQWLKIMGRNPSWFLSGGAYPVERVSWEDVQGFLARLNQLSGKTYRLPTEAEWEFAARSKGSSELYAGTSNGAEIGEVAWYAENSNRVTHPVGQKRPNLLGFYDLSGNVWEWVADWYQEDYYRQSPKYNPAGPARGDYRVLRGGSVEFAPWYLRTTVRGRDVPGRRYGNIGFRLAMD